MESSDLILAVPRGRVWTELAPLISAWGLEPEAAFHDPSCRRLRFRTTDKRIDLIRARSFDVAMFVAYGVAQFGVVGSDVIEECDFPELYVLSDLELACCRLVVAAPKDHVRPRIAFDPLWVATKYPRTTLRYFAAQGVRVQCVPMSGAIELAPSLGLSSHIVDLVASGATLAANGLQEQEEIARVSARVIVNRSAVKVRPFAMRPWLTRLCDLRSPLAPTA